MTLPKVIGPGDLKAKQDAAMYDPLKDPAAPVRFETLDEIKPHESVTLLLYGGAGTGKTPFIATAGPRTLIINTGAGLTTILSHVIKDKYYKTGMPIVATIREDRDPKTGLFTIAKAFDQVKNAIEWAMDKFPDRFDTIAVDDATQLNMMARNKGLELNEEFGRSQTLAKGKEEGGYVLAVQDYGAEMQLIDLFINETVGFCKKDHKHFILTAQERHVYTKKAVDASGKRFEEVLDRIRPGFTGKTFPDEVTGQFDLVWHTEAVRTGQGTIYRVNTEDSKSIKARSRFPGLFPSVIPNPDFLATVAAIKKYWEQGKVPTP